MAFRKSYGRRGGGLSYNAGKALIRRAVSSGRRSARRGMGGKKMQFLGLPLLVWAALGAAAYFFRDKLKAMFVKKTAA